MVSARVRSSSTAGEPDGDGVAEALVLASRSEPLHGQVARDAEEISRDRAPERVVPRGLPEDHQERLLDDVVAGVRAAHVDGIAVDGALVARKQLGKGVFIPPARPLEQSASSTSLM